jgi:magnesium chelatase family protein
VDRVRAAVVNTGAAWPMRRITIGLSPAAMPKQGSGFDLSTCHVGHLRYEPQGTDLHAHE